MMITRKRRSERSAKSSHVSRNFIVQIPYCSQYFLFKIFVIENYEILLQTIEKEIFIRRILINFESPIKVKVKRKPSLRIIEFASQ